MKILFTTDWHLTEKKPSSRRDVNFVENILKKVTEVLFIAREEDVDLVVLGGDVFDSPRVSFEIVNSLILVMREFNLPIYTILGSHDVVGYNIESVYSSSLGNLVLSGFVHLLDFVEKGGFSFQGINCGEFSLDEIRGDVVALHQPVSDIPLPYDYIELERLAPLGKIFLCGHIHKQFICKVDDSLFINPGPLVRTSVDERDIQPSVAIVDVARRKCYLRRLQNVVRDVFDLSLVSKSESSSTKAFDTFLEKLKARKFDSMSVESIFEILNSLKLDETIFSKCKEYIERSVYGSE